MLLFLIILGPLIILARDPYNILGVNKKANLPKIKKAYHNLSRKYHPDRNKDDPKASEKFSDITWAYEVLTNNTLRNAFDKGGEEAIKQAQSNSGRPGQQPFPTGGFYSGGFPNFFFNRMYTNTMGPIDWFEQSNVNLIQNSQEMNLQSNDIWPDVYFIIYEETEFAQKMANVFIDVADVLKEDYNFRAVDCRRPTEICKRIKMSTADFEISLISIREENYDVKFITKNKINTSRLRELIINKSPSGAKSISAVATLSNYLENSQKNNNIPPIILIVRGYNSELPVRVRRWTMENKHMANFLLSDSKSLTNAFTNTISTKNWETAAFLVTDAYLITPETTDWFAFDNENDVTIDLILQKWISFAKRKIGPYLNAVISPRELTWSVQHRGHCTTDDPSWCIIYFDHPEDKLFKELASAFKTKNIKQSKLYYMKKQTNYATNFGNELLIALKGKRRKYIVYDKKKSIDEWLESLMDSSTLMRNGIKLSKVKMNYKRYYRFLQSKLKRVFIDKTLQFERRSVS